jgi:hypothetical protein
MAITKFLYITLADSNGDGFDLSTGGIPLIYNGSARSVVDLITGVYRITQEATSGMGAVPWEIESIPLSSVDIEVTYNSGIPVLSNVPKNVGRYDFNIRTTLKSDPTYKGYFTTEYYGTIPVDIPGWESAVRTNAFISDVDGVALEKDKDPTKCLLIRPCPLTITFGDNVRTYNKIAGGISYTTSPKVLDPDSVDFGKDVQVGLAYGGPKSIAVYATPIEIGTYTVSANSIDMNYAGSADTTYTIRELTTSEAATAQQQYDTLLRSLPPKTRNWVDDSSSFSDNNAKQEFIANGILSILGETETVASLDKVDTLIQCTQNLPQKLMTLAAAKLLSLAAAYVPGLAIVNLITRTVQVINDVQKIMELIEFIKNNPYAFLNQILTATGTYKKLGSIASETVTNIEKTFPDSASAVGNVGQFIVDVANGVIDICEAADLYGNPITNKISADNTKVPKPVRGFVPLTNRQPMSAKSDYDYFQFHLRDALYKDNDKIKSLKDSGNTVELRNYVTMLTAVHELAYNWHDKIASTAAPVGLLSASQATNLQNIEDTLVNFGGVLEGIYGQPDTINSSTEISTRSLSGVTQNSLINTGLNAASTGLGALSGALNATGNFLSGETKYSLRLYRNEFNFAVKQQLAKHPYWSAETVKEYNERVQRIQYEMETGTPAIRNNPAFAKI